jgi:soluble lytic murein transglycosylase-like protein
MRLAVSFLLTAACAFAGESVVLTTGARMHVDRHEVEGSRIRLYNSTGYIEMNASLVRAFEPDQAQPAAPASQPEAASAAPAPAVQDAAPATPQQLADAAADKYGLPRSLVRSVMAAESGFAKGAISPKGAVGLMQLMPATAQSLGVNPNDPAQNVDGGTRYLRDLLIQYDGALWHALAAYNAGPGAVNKSPDGIPPYPETIRYVKRIHKSYQKARQAEQAVNATH